MRLGMACAFAALASQIRPDRRRHLMWVAPCLLDPFLGLLTVGARFGRLAILRRRMAKADRHAVARELPLLGDLVSVGLTGGLSLPQALEAAIPHLRSSLREELATVVRRGRQHGLSPVLESASGSAHRLYLLAARAIATGAPLAAAVDAFTDEVRAERRSDALERARRLPVLLMFPLALMILPGFVLLTVAPAIVGAVERLAS